MLHYLIILLSSSALHQSLESTTGHTNYHSVGINGINSDLDSSWIRHSQLLTSTHNQTLSSFASDEDLSPSSSSSHQFPPPLPQVAFLRSPSEPPPTLSVDPFYIEFRDQSRFWIQRILVPLVTIIGVIGNSMTIVIMTRRRMRSSTNFYLAALASIDMVYLIFIFLLSFKHYPQADSVDYLYYWVMYPYTLMIVDGCSNISVWLTVTFTFERFIVVTHPIRGKIMCTEARAKKVIIAVFVVCLTYVLPTPFEWNLDVRVDEATNRTRIAVVASEFGRNQLYKTIYYWTTSVMFSFIPLILLAVFNAFLIRSVQISRRTRSEMTQSNICYGTGSSTPLTGGGRSGHNNVLVVKNGTSGMNSKSPAVVGGGRSTSGSAKLSDHSTAQETKITIMLISVVLLFLVCQSPSAIMLIYSSIREFEANTKEAYLAIALNNIFNFLMAINAAGNFVLYSLLSQRYRRTLVQLFCPCLKGRLIRQQSYQRTLCSTAITQASASNKRSTEHLEVTISSSTTSNQCSPINGPHSRGKVSFGAENHSCSNLFAGHGESPSVCVNNNKLKTPSESDLNSASRFEMLETASPSDETSVEASSQAKAISEMVAT